MERPGRKTRDIRFFSEKNDEIVCLHSQWARDYARGLEQETWIQSYEANVPLDQTRFVHVARVDIRSEYFDGGWTTDFLLYLPDGRKEVRELASREQLTKRAYLERLELSRRYWTALDVDAWKVVITDDTAP